MKLIHIQSLEPVAVGDVVRSFRGEQGLVHHFVPPHKPSSSGHVSVRAAGGTEHYHYVGVWGMEWIDREDRRVRGSGAFIRDHEGGP